MSLTFKKMLFYLLALGPGDNYFDNSDNSHSGSATDSTS